MRDYLLPRPPPTRETTPRQRSRAVRTVAGYAHDASELAELLDMLGLSAAEAKVPTACRKPVAGPVRGHHLTIAELDALVADVRP